MEKAASETPIDATARVAEGGLKIERRFTAEGVHPFDEIAWEERDAIIGDPAAPAFEQRGVEFPETWSQNATNIVAQKYFRGPMGSPERERSVRQMIGRVAGTIAGWGRENGYFATDADAGAFEAELTHILLHQKAAFNSPVWFNVGFEEHPQCSACQPYDALISTPEGMVPIGELVEGDQVGREVYDANGTTRIIATKSNGRKPVYRVRLRNGSYVEATADHVVKAVENRRGRPAWRRVDELHAGMRMHLHPHRTRVAERALVTAGEIEADCLSELGGVALDGATEQETLVGRAEAALAGWLQADGFVGQYDTGTNRSLTMEFIVANEDEMRWVSENLDIAFPDVHRHVRLADTQETVVHRIRLYGEVLREFVESWDLLPRGTEIRVPPKLWTASQDEVCAYLRSVFQADGYVTVQRSSGSEQGRIGLGVISERWTEDLQILLHSIGLYSRRLRKHEPRADRHDLHELSISIGSERARFAELVGFVARDKQDRLIESLGLRGLKRCPDLREEEIISIEEVGLQEVYDIQTESGEYLTNNVAVHNCFILSVEDTMESILAWNTKEGTIFRGGSGSGINLSNIRGSTEQLSKGGFASGPVSFMRGADAWAGTIKSGGKTRRAAKMVVLDVDHPDIEDFIWCKAREEDKAAALRDAGFDMSIDGDGFTSIQYQNANNSVRITDEFMEAVEAGSDWNLTARKDGSTIKTLPARDLLEQLSEAAWRCADPGVQFDTIINDWHTCPESGRINASNPCCFVGETLVSTSDGAIPIRELQERFEADEALPEVDCLDVDSDEPVRAQVTRAWVAGHASQLCRVRTFRGQELLCTPEHRFLSEAGVWIAAEALRTGDVLRAISTVDSGVGEMLERVVVTTTDQVSEVEYVRAGYLEVFDIEVAGHHNFVVLADDRSPGIVVHNSEYMHVDDSACNLASINLMKFRREDGSFDTADFEHTVDTVLLAQEIVVGPSSYPTEEIGANARRFRQLGLGYANLGAYLMSNGMPYDSDEGRAVAAAITALMTGRGYRKSAEVAAAIGPYEEYAKNREPHNAVMRMHRDASHDIPDSFVGDAALLEAARRSWDEAVALGDEHGYRNAQATVLAPTGTISFLMDCDTTGIEPDFSLVKYKELVGGGQMTIVNRSVPLALRTLGYSDEGIEQIAAYVNDKGTIVGAPGLEDAHLPVFDVAVGSRAISHMGHIGMMSATQPFLSGAISKTVNLPETATVEDIADAYTEGWKGGLKALAIYRDGSKTAQALRTDAGDAVGVDDEEIAQPVPVRRRMPAERESLTHKFSIAGQEGYITAGKYPDGTVGEIFLTDIGKEGSTLRGMMNAFATAVSIGLQYGVPLEVLVNKFSYMRFDPEGMTKNQEIPFAKSMPDYIMRWLASRFIDDVDAHEDLGILTKQVRARKEAQQSLFSPDTAGPTNGNGNGREAHAEPAAGASGSGAAIPAAAAMTDTPPVVPARISRSLDLGPACDQCGGMMQRTGSCYTCTSCGNNTGCG